MAGILSRFFLMHLHQLATELDEKQVLGADVLISAIYCDSRKVTPGALFVAVTGFRADGHDYIGEAVAGGAVGVVVQADRQAKWQAVVEEGRLPAIVVADSRRALAALAAAFYGHPGRRLRVIGVTGTDGKTTTIHLISALLEAAGYRTGVLSTVHCKVGDRLFANEYRFTTPEAPQVQALLADMVAAGADYAILESTSHGLALHRLDGCEYDVAVMTNVTADHLDFHGSQEEYLAAKGCLFAMLDLAADKGVEKVAVLNADEPACDYFATLTRARIVTYAVQKAADLRASDIVADEWGSRFRLRAGGSELEVALGLPGLFNVYNSLAAAAVALSQGMSLAAVRDALASFPGVPGRLERIDEGQPFTVVVDFAHAPEALRRVLAFLREQCRGRLIVVFGCIGERERPRRLGMGLAAGELADFTIVTNDNPFGEEPEAILAEIAQGLEKAGRHEEHHFVRIPDRKEAIALALAMAVEGDIVLLAGKGHEQSITIGDTVIPWDDRRVARELLREMLS
ncbi:MAG: UDP-N-acetylmuramoyl-L-alanyl-D-glutamate--2,6-diaminopimelate ligase [Dehalococcoidia bacterium]